MFLSFGLCQSGLLVIGNAAPLLKKLGADVPFLVANAWFLVSYIGLVNAAGAYWYWEAIPTT